MVTGKLELAMLVQYLPLPVVGGYLAFLGLYCLEAGLTLMSGVQVASNNTAAISSAAATTATAAITSTSTTTTRS